MTPKYILLFFLICMALFSSVSQPIFRGGRQNLGKEINDHFIQCWPVFSADGGTLYFSQGSGANQQLEAWRSTADSSGRITGKEKIKSLNPNINQPKYLLQALSSHQYLVSGSYQVHKNQLLYSRGMSVFDSPKGSDEFNPAAFQKKPSFLLDSIFKRNNIFPFYHNFFHLFAFSKEEGTHADIYLLINETATDKGRIIKLPAAINSPFNEATPWLDDEGRFLYFASDRPGGLGSLDIYVSERLDGSFQNWSVPRNLGSEVNSNGADYSFLIDPAGAFGYFVSEKNTYGNSDIFRIGLQQADPGYFSPFLLKTDRPDTSLAFNPGTYLPNNIVFLLDISHSMAESRKMILLKKSMYRLVAQLRATDKVSLVIFGSGVETLISGESAKNKSAILDAISSLSANGGATNISAGLQRAYGEATQHFMPAANNQLLIITDAVFKLKPKDEEMVARSTGILLTGVVVGDDPGVSAAFGPLLAKANGQLLVIRDETADLNNLLRNVRMNALPKN